MAMSRELSTIEMNIDQELLIATQSFWCSTTNTMVLPLGPIGPTILDITTILGTSPSDLPVDVAFFGYEFDLDLKTVFDKHAIEVLTKKDHKSLKDEVHKLHKNFFNYNTLINHFTGSEEKKLKSG